MPCPQQDVIRLSLAGVVAVVLQWVAVGDRRQAGGLCFTPIVGGGSVCLPCTQLPLVSRVSVPVSTLGIEDTIRPGGESPRPGEVHITMGETVRK